MPHYREKSGRAEYRPVGNSKVLGRFKQSTLIRLLLALLVGIFFISNFRSHSARSTGFPKEVKETIIHNCHDLDVLGLSEDCTEETGFERETPKTHRKNQKYLSYAPPPEDSTQWNSPYGLVLSYEAQYDAYRPRRTTEQRFMTRRTMQCLVGFSMSIIWDFTFHDSIKQASDFGAYGTSMAKANSTITCPDLSKESSAHMHIYINCGFEIERDAWGNPASDKDYGEIETCVKMAYSWVKGRALDFGNTGPWYNVCGQAEDGELHCLRDVFKVVQQIDDT